MLANVVTTLAKVPSESLIEAGDSVGKSRVTVWHCNRNRSQLMLSPSYIPAGFTIYNISSSICYIFCSSICRLPFFLLSFFSSFNFLEPEAVENQ